MGAFGDRRRCKGILANVLVACFSVVCAPSHGEAIEKHLCIEEQSIGFAWNGVAWAQARFNVHEKFVVADLSPEQKAEPWNLNKFDVGVSEFGKDIAVYWCKSSPNNSFECHGPAGIMEIDLNTKRFVEVYPYGYADGKDDGRNNPAVSLGTCYKL